MPMITSQGVVGIDRAAYLEEINTRAKRALGNDLNVDSETPQGQLFGILADLASSLDDGIVFVANGQDPNTATGRQIDVLARPFGIVRRAATRTAATVTVTGTASSILSAGTDLSTPDSTDFVTTSRVEIGLDGTVDVEIQAVDAGPVALSENAVLTVPTVSFITGIAVVAGTVVLGENAENDDDYRQRFRLTVALNAVGSIDSIRANLLALRTVREARIYENDTDSNKDFTTEAGVSGLTTVPAHSLVIVVDSQDVANVGNMIILTKPSGTGTVGNIVYKGNTALGFGATVRYYETQSMNVSVTIAITARPGFPFGGLGRIRTTVRDYINGLSIGEIINNADLTFAALSTGNLNLSSISVSGSANGQVFGGGVDISSVSGQQAFVLNGQSLSITVTAGSSGTEIAILLQDAIDANSSFDDVTVMHRTSDEQSRFDIRGLPATATTLTGGDDLFGATGRQVVDGSTVTDLISDDAGI